MTIETTMEYRGTKHLISRKGEPITLVRLEDAEGEQVTLYTAREPIAQKGDRVQVVIHLRDVRGSCELG